MRACSCVLRPSVLLPWRSSLFDIAATLVRALRLAGDGFGTCIIFYYYYYLLYHHYHYYHYILYHHCHHYHYHCYHYHNSKVPKRRPGDGSGACEAAEGTDHRRRRSCRGTNRSRRYPQTSARQRMSASRGGGARGATTTTTTRTAGSGSSDGRLGECGVALR